MQRIQINQYGMIAIIFIIFIVFYNWFSYSYNVNINLTSNSISVKSLLATSVVLAQRAGNEIRKIQAGHKLSIKRKPVKGIASKEILTGADISSHNILVSGFSTLFSDIKIISEEKSSKSRKPTFDSVISLDNVVMKSVTHDYIIKSEDLAVWIDPLDATQEFTENLLQFVTVMVCVAFKGHPIAGVIHFPFYNSTYWAWKGQGTSPNLNDFLIQSTESTKSKTLKIVVSRSHSGDVNSTLHNLLGSDIEIEPAGGSGYKVLEVIKRKYDIYYHQTAIKKWDLCAPQAIIEAVGGVLTDLKGRRILYKPDSNSVLKSGVLATLDKTLHNSFVSKTSQLSL